jgi:hypothetical protein
MIRVLCTPAVTDKESETILVSSPAQDSSSQRLEEAIEVKDRRGMRGLHFCCISDSVHAGTHSTSLNIHIRIKECEE